MLGLVATAAVAGADVGPPGPCTHHVAPEGSDAGHGTPAAPWRTVDHAVNAADDPVNPVGPGSVICVAPGTYRERVRFRRGGTDDRHRITLAADLALTAGDPTRVVIDGTVNGHGVRYDGECQAAIRIEDVSHVRVSGVTVLNRGNPFFPTADPALAAQCKAIGVGVSASAPGATVDDVVIDHVVVRDIRPADGNPHAFGTPLSVGALAAGAAVTHLQVRASRFADSDTAGPTITSGLIALQGTVTDFVIDGNTFDSPDLLAIDVGGNQGFTRVGDAYVNTLANYPQRGVISDNQLLSPDSPAGNYAIQLQAAQQILVERNYFRNVGRGIGVTTEPPCLVTSYVRGKDVWIRDNVFVNTWISDLTTGAFAGSTKCPGDPLPAYLSTENVWFTSNTVVRPAAAPPFIHAPSISIVSAGGEGLTGDSRIADNVFVSFDPIIDATLPARASASASLTVDDNLVQFVGPAEIAPFRWNGAPLDAAAWSGSFDRHGTFASPTAELFTSTAHREDFHPIAGGAARELSPVSPRGWPDDLGPARFGTFTPPEPHRGAGVHDRGVGDVGARRR